MGVVHRIVALAAVLLAGVAAPTGARVMGFFSPPFFLVPHFCPPPFPIPIPSCVPITPLTPTVHEHKAQNVCRGIHSSLCCVLAPRSPYAQPIFSIRGLEEASPDGFSAGNEGRHLLAGAGDLLRQMHRMRHQDHKVGKEGSPGGCQSSYMEPTGCHQFVPLSIRPTRVVLLHHSRVPSDWSHGHTGVSINRCFDLQKIT